jgi:hypothetical protein
LFAELKDGEDPDGGWNGADTVDSVTRWLERIGIDPARSPGQLETRFGRELAVARLARVVAAHSVGESDRSGDRVDGPGDDVDLDRVARLVRAAGVECAVDTPGGGIAVLVAGPPQDGPRWAFPWAAHAGPGRYRWDRPTASTATLMVGPDDGGQVAPTSVARVGAVTEVQIAALIVAQTRIADPRFPLTADELAAIGLDGDSRG